MEGCSSARTTRVPPPNRFGVRPSALWLPRARRRQRHRVAVRPRDTRVHRLPGNTRMRALQQEPRLRPTHQLARRQSHPPAVFHLHGRRRSALESLRFWTSASASAPSCCDLSGLCFVSAAVLPADRAAGESQRGCPWGCERLDGYRKRRRGSG
jgi:hypothetical protein